LKEKGEQPTGVLPIVGLDIGAISSRNSVLLCFGLTNFIELLYFLFIFSQNNRQLFPADGFLISHHRQYLAVG
jgi:hypothetical protein